MDNISSMKTSSDEVGESSGDKKAVEIPDLPTEDEKVVEISAPPSRKKKKVEAPDPQNWTVTEYEYYWHKERALHFEYAGGSGFHDLNDIERKVGYSAGDLDDKLDYEDERDFYPNGKRAREYFNKKDISIENAKVLYRKKYAALRLVCKIEDIARRLVDENVIDKCHLFYHVEMYDKTAYLDESDYEECWTSLLKSSERPLSVELRNQLKEANITESEFSKIISAMYWKLLSFGPVCSTIERIGREDVISVLNDLSLDDKSYQSIKILFNLDEPVKWRLE